MYVKTLICVQTTEIMSVRDNSGSDIGGSTVFIKSFKCL